MATILDLLQALNLGNLPPLPDPATPLTPTFTGAPLPAPLGNAPIPLTTAGQAPVPQYGGPSQVTEPPQAPFDPAIIAQLLATQGPAPTPPPPRSRADKIFNAIAGFGAGFQGNGPQFLAQLQEPQRRYEAQLRDYNENRSRLAQTGAEIGLRRQEAKTRRAQELSDREFNAELDRETRRLKLSSDRETQLLADALLSRRQREDDERAAKLAEQKDRAAKETQRNNIYQKLISENFAPAKVASEMADNIVHGKPMSVSTEKWRSVKEQKLTAQLARLNGGGSGTAAQPLMAQLENGQVVPASLVDKGKGIVAIGGKPVKVTGYIGGKIPAQPKAAQGKTSDPLGIR